MIHKLRNGLLLVPLVLCFACAGPAQEPDPDPVESVAARPSPAGTGDAGLGDGFLVWESNRSGRWRLWIRTLSPGEPRQLTPDEGRRLHCCPHISPDGKQVAYLSLPADQDGYPRGGATGRLMVIGPDGTEPAAVVDGARNYYENRAVVWRSAAELVYIRPDGSTALLDLGTGDSRVLSPGGGDSGPWLINSPLTWAASGNGAFAPFDRDRGRVLDRGPRPGCQPYFSHDGIWGFWVVAPGGPIHRLHLDSGSDTLLLKKSDPRMPPGHGYLYFPMLSSDSTLLAFGASDDQHGHFSADYEVFVAETDPATLEIIGPPHRYTNHPATDRFPDVYRRPLPLGRHFGEAPYRWTSPPQNDAEDWQWNYGDGDTSQGPTGEHLYTDAGRYSITARSGALQLYGQVVVGAAAAPRVLSSVLRRNGTEILVNFDEAVNITDLDARLESGIPLAVTELDRDNRRLRIRPAHPLTADDVLTLRGLTDRAQVANVLPPTAVAVQLPSWPAARDSLTLGWQTGDAANLLYDPDLAAETAVTMTPRGLARFDAFFRMQPEGGRFEAPEAVSRRVVLASKKTYEISIEMTIKPARLARPGPAIIVTSASKSRRNFTLEQEGSGLFLIPRFKSRGEKALPRIHLLDLPAAEPAHVVVTYAPGALRAYLDGQIVLEETSIQGGFFHWKPAPLSFGSDWNGKRPWRGRLEGVAIYSRALEKEEVQESLRRYRSQIEDRRALSSWKVRGRQEACSQPPTLEQIDPYREALVICHFQVRTILSGGELPASVRVARWSMLDGRRLPLETGGAKTQELELLLFEENPQLESVYLSDTLEPAVEGQLFFLP